MNRFILKNTFMTMLLSPLFVSAYQPNLSVIQLIVFETEFV